MLKVTWLALVMLMSSLVHQAFVAANLAFQKVLFTESFD
jgi:hypothetical protein